MQLQQDGEPQKPFRFLDLPVEIRNNIYNILLCTPPPSKARRIGQYDLLPEPTDMAYIRHPLATQILSTNRQIHTEGRDSMLRGNQFIRIKTLGGSYRIDLLMQEAQLPVMRTCALPPAIAKGVVMTHFTGWNKHAKSYPTDTHATRQTETDLVILRHDLDAFCQALALRGSHNLREFGNRSHHILDIHNPFDDSLSPDFMGEENQQRLLQPYRHHLHGFAQLSVHGHVVAEVAKSVGQFVAEVRPFKPEQVVEELRRKKDLGNSAFRQRSFHEASEAYKSGLCALRIRMQEASWGEVKADGGPAFLYALAETYYQILLNSTQNILTYIQDAHDVNPNDNVSLGRIIMLGRKAEDYVQAAMVSMKKILLPGVSRRRVCCTGSLKLRGQHLLPVKICFCSRRPPLSFQLQLPHLSN